MSWIPRYVVLGCVLLDAQAALAQGIGRQVAVLASRSELHQHLAGELEQALLRTGHRSFRLNLAITSQPASDTAAPETRLSTEASAATLQELRAGRPSLLVAIGTSALRLAGEAPPTLPIVYCAVPSLLDRPWLRGRRVAGVASDASPVVQIQWIGRLSPQARRIGVIHSRAFDQHVEALAKAGREAGLTLVSVRAGAEDFPQAIERLELKACDAALIVPDDQMFRAVDVQTLLLWGLRAKKPVWGCTREIVKVGAFAGVYAEDVDVAAQVAELVGNMLAGKIEKSKVYYPERPRCAVNEHTADLIGLSLGQDVLADVSFKFQRQ